MTERQIYSSTSIINESVNDIYQDDGFDDEPDYERNAHTFKNRGYNKEFFKVKAKDNTIIVKKFSSESRKEMIEKRIEMNYSQSTLAPKIEITVDKLRQIELGIIKPSNKELKVINKELNLKLYFV